MGSCKIVLVSSKQVTCKKCGGYNFKENKAGILRCMKCKTVLVEGK